ncbi:MAG: hypothetical protein B6D55_02520 [Candidatus Omnitrophica bacterium 4484_70.2]|nr:MAG: hypothetical protein B6D55_02520 [Candidatus Omnitrophica bacterium 4484_70.2]
MRKILFFIIFCLFFAGKIYPQDLSKIISSTKEENLKQLKKLNELRKEISNQRLSLVNKLKELRAEVKKLREDVYDLKKLRWAKEEHFLHLKEEVEGLREDVKFSSLLIFEYRKNMFKRASLAEEKKFEDKLKRIDRLLNKNNNASSLEALNPLVELTIVRNREVLGGDIFEGEVLDTKGILVKGDFIILGPFVYFVSKEKNLAGLVGEKLGSLVPSLLIEFPSSSFEDLLENKISSIPMDFSLGDAIKKESFKRGWFEHLKAGGIIMVPILGLGILCIILAIIKFISLIRLKINVEDKLDQIIELLHSQDIEKAKRVAASLGRPLAPIILEGIEHHKASREHLEEIMHEEILSQIPFLEKYISVFSVSAGVSPLLGLLGTVTGIIRTFNVVSLFGTTKTHLLSAGISEALITTEYGLIVAIPSLLLYAYFSRKVKRIVGVLEQTTLGFINSIKIKKGE